MYFFEDKMIGLKAPQTFITSVMVNLESTLYDIGDIIV